VAVFNLQICRYVHVLKKIKNFIGVYLAVLVLVVSKIGGKSHLAALSHNAFSLLKVIQMRLAAKEVKW